MTLELLRSIGRAKAGTRMLVVEPFDAVNARAGGRVALPMGTRLEMTCSRYNGQSIAAVAELDHLQMVYIFAEHYHCVERAPIK